jgi:hypothetical protein
MNIPALRAPADLPAADARIPGVTVRLVFVVVAVLLALVVFGPGGWFAVGTLLALLAAWAPYYLLGWLLILMLALGELGHQAELSWRILVLLAGVQLLHVLSALMLELPWRGWLQPEVFVRPLLRLFAIQIPVQLLAVAALLLLAPNAHGHRPLTVTAFAVIGAVALACLTLVLLRSRPDQPAHP